MAKQAWCNGRIGMIGPSLLGISQWLTAKEAPPSLKVIVPQVACGDCYGLLWYPAGMTPGPGREARKLSPGAEAEYATSVQHRNLDGWWRERLTLAPDVKAIAGRGVAAFISGGLDDYISPANLRAYEQFDSNRKRLLFAPHAHGWQIDFLQELQVQWLDHWLKDADNGVEQAPKVILFVKGVDRWRTEADWPIPDARMATLFLQAGHSQTIDSLNDGAMTAQQASGASATLPYVPGAGPALPVLLSATVGRPDGDQREAETKVLTWTTAPLPVATEVTGYSHVSLWAASRPGRCRSRRPSAHPRSGVPGNPGALRQQATHATRQTNRRLDQPANAEQPRLNANPVQEPTSCLFPPALVFAAGSRRHPLRHVPWAGSHCISSRNAKTAQ